MSEERLFGFGYKDSEFVVTINSESPDSVTIWYDSGLCPITISRDNLLRMLAATAGNDRTCVDCRHLDVSSGEDGFYPGEHSCMGIACGKQIWTLDNEDDQAAFVRNFRTARTCEHFEAAE